MNPTISSLILSIILSAILIGCNTQPVEVTVKMEQPRDTIIVTKEVHDTVLIGNIKNKSDLDNVALYAMRVKNYELYNRQYYQYQYRHFGYTCGENVIASRWARSIKTNFGWVALPKAFKLPIKHETIFRTDSTLKDGTYGYVNDDDILLCTVIKNDMITEAWNISKNGKIFEADSNTSRMHTKNGFLIEIE